MSPKALLESACDSTADQTFQSITQIKLQTDIHLKAPKPAYEKTATMSETTFYQDVIRWISQEMSY